MVAFLEWRADIVFIFLFLENIWYFTAPAIALGDHLVLIQRRPFRVFLWILPSNVAMAESPRRGPIISMHKNKYTLPNAVLPKGIVRPLYITETDSVYNLIF